MKVSKIVFAGKEKVEIREEEQDYRIKGNEVRIETTISMVSPGTELAALNGTHSKSQIAEPPAWLKYPSNPGYLMCGTIIEVGDTVRNLKKGDRVVGEGPGVWNSHASHLVMDSADWKIVPIADNVSFEEAVFTKMGSIAMTGPRVLHLNFGDTVVVMGLGLVGQIASRLSLLAGAGRVIGVDPLEKRRALISSFSGMTALAPDDKLLSSACVPGDRLSGFDHIIEASGHPSAFLKACEIGRIRAKIAVLSSPHKHFEIRLYDHIHSKGLQVLGAHGFVLPFTPEVNDNWTDARQRRFFMQLMSEKRMDVTPLITHKVSFTQAPAMYKGLLSNPGDYLAVLFDWRK